ncbi:MAG: hypothetical protein AAGU06_03665 [Candidatus Shapirobacteria bacterium]
MKIDYDVTLKGFICIPRSVIPDLIKELGFSGFAKYLVLVSQADFDLKHKNFSKIIRDDKKLGESFYTSSSTFYKSRKFLTEKGFLISDDGVSKVPSMDAFNSKLLTASTKKGISITTEMLKNWKIFEEEHKKYVEKMQKNWVPNGP